MLKWRQCPVFLEAKASPKDLPTNKKSKNATEVVAQIADYARVVFTARPFQLFVYGILLCGNQFVLAFFDRRGVVLSPSYTLPSSGSDSDTEGLKSFIRIALRLLWDASPVDLGHDPAVTLIPGQTYHQVKYPRFQVKLSSSDKDTRRWNTVGIPLFVSQSLLGRGTHVWGVIDALSFAPCVLKTTWRTKGRQAESQIYVDIKRLYRNADNDSTSLPETSTKSRSDVQTSDPQPRGMARLLTGGDVKYMGAPVSAYRLRGTASDSPLHAHSGAISLPVADMPDVMLTRVVLEDFGVPLWMYTSPLQLGHALLKIVEGTFLSLSHRYWKT